MSLIDKLREEYKRAYSHRQNLTRELTQAEKNLLMSMSKSRGVNKNNISGFFFLSFSHAEILLTPMFIWQTWFYHRFIHQQTINQKNDFPVLKVQAVRKAFEDRVRDGTFRLNQGYEIGDLKKVISSLLSVYETLQIISEKEENVYFINYDEIPNFPAMEQNIYVNLYFDFIGKKMKSVPIQVDEFPENMKNSILDFFYYWKNGRTGCWLGDQYKLTPQQKRFIGFDLLIYSNNNLLDKALQLLNNEQKRAVSYYLQKEQYTPSQICEMLVKNHGANPQRNSSGTYLILPYVEEYIFSSIWLWIV